MSDDQPIPRMLRDLSRAAAAQRSAEVRTTLLVQGLRSYGCSWADIARVLGVSRQAARQRWAPQELA